jgi:hypothetical protein
LHTTGRRHEARRSTPVAASQTRWSPDPSPDRPAAVRSTLERLEAKRIHQVPEWGPGRPPGRPRPRVLPVRAHRQLTAADPAVYVRLPTFTPTSPYPGAGPLGASEASAVRIEDYTETFAAAVSSTCSTRAASRPPCRSRCPSFGSSRHAADSGLGGRWCCAHLGHLTLGCAQVSAAGCSPFRAAALRISACPPQYSDGGQVSVERLQISRGGHHRQETPLPCCQ